MDIRFEDQAAFQRAALKGALGAAGGAALAAFSGAPLLLVPLAAAGCAATALSRRKPQALAAAAAVTAALSGAWVPAGLALCGALYAVALAAARNEGAQERGEKGAGAAATLCAAALCALSFWWTLELVPALAAALSPLAPPVLPASLAGAAAGLWAGAAAALLHVSADADAVEARLSSLRLALGPELRPLAERAAAARRSALASLRKAAPAGASRADLRRLLDGLTLGALQLSARAAELSFAVAPAAAEELAKRHAALLESARSSSDAVVRASYERAAGALSAQLEHGTRARGKRERLVARLHEEVAQLERARFALSLLRGAEEGSGHLELDLLGEELQQSALACEADPDLDDARAPVAAA